MKLNMLVKQRHTRRYPILEIGDKVKIYRKKKVGEKERTSNFSQNVYEVEKIVRSLGQPFFILKGLERQYMRAELLKV